MTATAPSLADRALAHLRQQPEGVELTSAEIAAVIGCQASQMLSILRAALDRGEVRFRFARNRGERKCWSWCQPASDAFDADEARGGRPLQRTVPAAATVPPLVGAPNSVFGLIQASRSSRNLPTEAST